MTLHTEIVAIYVSWKIFKGKRYSRNYGTILY